MIFTHPSLPPHRITIPFILGIQRNPRGLAGGCEGVQWALALRTPSQPPANPQATPNEVYQDDGEKKELKQLD